MATKEQFQSICAKLEKRLSGLDIKVKVSENTGTKIKFSLGANDYVMFPWEEYGYWTVKTLYYTGLKGKKTDNITRTVTVTAVCKGYFNPMVSQILNFQTAIETAKAEAEAAAAAVAAAEAAAAITPAEIALQEAETSVLDN